MGTILYFRDRARQSVAELMLDDGARLRVQLDRDGLLIQACDIEGHPNRVLFGARPRLASAIIAGLAAPDGTDERKSPLRIVADTLVRFDRAEPVRNAFEEAARGINENWATEAQWRSRTFSEKVVDAAMSLMLVLGLGIVIIGGIAWSVVHFSHDSNAPTPVRVVAAAVVPDPAPEQAAPPRAEAIPVQQRAAPPPVPLVDPAQLRLGVTKIESFVDTRRDRTRLLVSFTNASPVPLHFVVDHFTPTLDGQVTANQFCAKSTFQIGPGETVRLACSEVAYGVSRMAAEGEVDLAYHYGQGVAGEDRQVAARLKVSMTGRDLVWMITSSADDLVRH